MQRRSFFRSIAKAAAIVALAPQLAFRVAPKIITPPAPTLDELFDAAWAIKASRVPSDQIDILVDRVTAEKIQKAMSDYYDSAYRPS